jgi:hypothetical protein
MVCINVDMAQTCYGGAASMTSAGASEDQSNVYPPHAGRSGGKQNANERKADNNGVYHVGSRILLSKTRWSVFMKRGRGHKGLVVC